MFSTVLPPKFNSISLIVYRYKAQKELLLQCIDVTCYVIKQMVNTTAYTREVCQALKKLESLSAIASCDSYTFIVLSNLVKYISAIFRQYKFMPLLRVF